MSWTVVFSVVRDDTSTAWHHENIAAGSVDFGDLLTVSEYNAWKKTNYEDNNKFVSLERTESDDETTLTEVRVFATLDDQAAFVAEDNVIARTVIRTEYEEANGITRSKESATET